MFNSCGSFTFPSSKHTFKWCCMQPLSMIAGCQLIPHSHSTVTAASNGLLPGNRTRTQHVILREYAPLWNPVWVDKEPNGNFDWTSQRGCSPSADTEVPARVQRQRVLNESWVVSYDWQGLGAPLPLLPWSHWWLNGVNRRDRVLTPLSGQNLRPITFSVCSNCKSCVDSVGGWGKKRQSKSQIKRLSFNPLDRAGQRK